MCGKRRKRDSKWGGDGGLQTNICGGRGKGTQSIRNYKRKKRLKKNHRRISAVRKRPETLEGPCPKRRNKRRNKKGGLVGMERVGPLLQRGREGGEP